MNNDELFERIVKVIDAKLDEKLEPIKKNMATKAEIHDIAEGMADFFIRNGKRWMKLTSVLQPLKTM